MLCSQISVIQVRVPPLPSRTVISCASTATSVSCKYTRWVINADVGYDINVPSVSWTELSVRTIALTSGQHKPKSSNGLRIVLDKVHRRITFRLSVVLEIHCLLFQQRESRVRRNLGTHTTRLLPSGSATLRYLWQLLVEQGKALCCNTFQSVEPEGRSRITSLVHRDPQEYTKTCLMEIFVRKSGLGYGCISFP